MTKWKTVFIGFILAVIVKAFFAPYEFVGLMLIGFIVGYLAKSGILGGLWNAAVAGALGTIISAIMFVLAATVGGAFFGPSAGLSGFTLSGISSLFIVLNDLIYYAIVMGIMGAIGGAIAHKE